jgi:uncharacterized phage-associated protein
VRFPFNERKAAQAAAYLLSRHGGRFNYMHLLKLLYLADRKKLLERGTPITGDRMVSMKLGPTLSCLLNRINQPPEDGDAPWYSYVSPPSNYEVSLRETNPSTDELSRYDKRILDEVDMEYGTLDIWELSKWMHRQLPEYEKTKSSKTIPPERVLRFAGKSPEEIDEIAARADASSAMDHLLAE